MSNILLILPHTFGYGDHISNLARQNGLDIIVKYDRPKVNFLNKVLARLFPELISRWNQVYYDQLLSLCEAKCIDKVVIVKGESTPIAFFEILREKGIQSIYYTWDSVTNFPKSAKLFKLANRSYSFDKLDCSKYGVDYKHLFTIISLFDLQENKRIYDLSFVGTLHSNRMELVEALSTKKGSFVYLYSPNLLVDLVRIGRIDFRSIIKIKRYVRRNMLNLSEVFNIYNASKCVVDIAHKNQSGLTMRSIEAISCGCKLITNNCSILQEDWYNPDVIFFINELSELGEDKLKVWLDKEIINDDYKEWLEKFKRVTLFEKWILNF